MAQRDDTTGSALQAQPPQFQEDVQEPIKKKQPAVVQPAQPVAKKPNIPVPSSAVTKRYNVLDRTPFWETEGFKKFVQIIRNAPQGAPRGSFTETYKTQVNTLLPNAKEQKPSPLPSSSTYKQPGQATLSDVEKKVRNEVVQSMPNILPAGTTKQQVQTIIDAKVKARMDEIKRPRYIFLTDGTPFYLEKSNERADYLASIQDLPPAQKLWAQLKYDVPYRMGQMLSGLGEPAYRLEETLTDTNDPTNIIGPLIQSGYNAAILGYEYVRGAGLALTSNKTREQHIQELEALRVRDPAKAPMYDQMIARQKNFIAANEATDQRIQLAKDAINRSWAKVNDAKQWLKDHPDISKDLASHDMKRRMQAYEAIRQQQASAATEAGSLRAQATTAYRSGDYKAAMDYILKAQDADSRSETGDAYGAYTWIREPEREKAFRQDAALLELQKGMPLSREELRRVKDYHTNAWTEMGGQFLFDPLNLIPANVLEEVFKLPGKAARATISTLREDIPFVGKTLDVLGTPIRFLKRQAVSSAGNQIARETHYAIERALTTYTDNEEAIRVVDQISNMAAEMRRAPTLEEAQGIFTRYQSQVDGLRNITFSDAKKLADASEYLPPAQWGKMFEDALTKTDGQRLAAMDGFATEFRKAYVAPHRITEGGMALDDTITGWITKTARNLSGDEINDALKLNGFDEAVKRFGETLKPGTRQFIKNTNRAFEYMLQSAAWFRDTWSTLVLSTPRWPINNIIDSSSRSLLAGENILSDLKTLFTHTQRQFADELGVVPLDITQSMARMDLDFSENVTTKLLSGEFQPNAGLFSYWAEEYKRLRGTDAAIAKREIFNSFLNGMKDGKLKSALLWTMDGFGSKLPTLVDAFPGAVGDFNTAIEFTLRLRMLHTQYFRLLDELEPVFAARGLEGLTPATQEIAKQIWKESRSNPSRIKTMVDEIVGNVKTGRPMEWSFLTPKNIDELGKGMDPVQKAVFVDHFRTSVNEFIQESNKAGRRLTTEEVGKFVDDYSAQMKNEIQNVMAQNWDIRQADGSIRKDGMINPVPKMTDVQGSLPKRIEELPRTQTVAEATTRIRRYKSFRAQVPADIANDFKTAVSDFADVVQKTGDRVRYVPGINGKPVIEIGDDALKLKPNQFYDQLHEALIDTLKYSNEDNILRGGFQTIGEYDQTLRRFMSDKEGPTRLLADNERQFATIVDQFTKNPQIMELLKRTGRKEFAFDAAVDVYRHFGSYSDVYGFDRPIKQLVEEMSSGKSIPTPGYYSAAAREEAVATNRLARIQTDNPELRAKIMNFMDEWGANRSQLHQYRFSFDVNPLQGSARSKAWETIYYGQGAEDFLKEAKIKNTLADLFASNPVEAEKFLDDTLQDFPTYFLKEHGFDVVWDANHTKILEMSYIRNGKKVKVINEFSRAAVQDFFFAPTTRAEMRKNPILQIAADGTPNVHRQLSMTIRDTFKMPDRYASSWASVIENHARRWAEETGQDVSKYYERLGFQRLEKGYYGLGTMKDLRIVKGGAVSRLPDGGFMFYGLGKSDFEGLVRETGELFFDDLKEMARYSDKAANDLKVIQDFVESKSKRRIIAGKMDVHQSDIFTELFTRYVAEGIGPDIKLKAGFERFKSYLSDTFEAVHTTPLGQDLTEDVYRRLNGLFAENQMRVAPVANVREANLMAREAGLKVSDDELLKLINENVPAVNYDKAAWESWKTDHAAELQGVSPDALDNPQSAIDVLQTNLNTELDGVRANYDRLLAEPGADQVILNGQREADLLSTEKKYNQAIKDIKQAINYEARDTFTHLGEVPTDVVRQALLKKNPTATITLDNEMQQAWEAWKMQRGLKGFPEDALQSSQSFKRYLQQRMEQEWSEVSWQYNRLLADTEHFEDALMTHLAGGEFATSFSPRVPEYMMGDGMKTWIRNNEAMVGNYEAALDIIGGWRTHLEDMVNGINPMQDLSKAQLSELAQWSDQASIGKADLISLILKGGTSPTGRAYEGAISTVNRFMIDYQTRNVFDQAMRNLFPFWMFPSRSLPFWTETLATHPQLIAAYEKIQRMSRSQRYQAGAVTSQGKPLPSLDGYIQVPGTDLWFNPLAPLSFRYVLDIWKTADDILYQQQKEDDIDPQAYLAKEMMETSQIYGFSMAPWMSFFFKQQFGIPDEIVPRFPLTPQISLIPRWRVQDMIDKANQINFAGIRGWGDAIYPEANWHDYIVERQILENSLQQIQEQNLSEAQKTALRHDMTEAIKNHSGPVWEAAYKQVTTDETYRNWGSFFTGIYAKPFTDGQAELLRLRNEMNLLKSSLNNEFQTSVFNLPDDASQAYNNYINKLGTDEGWVYRLYTDIGWVKNDLGNPVPADERNKWLAVQIQQDENQVLYYQKSKDVYAEYNKSLRSLPLGTPYEEYQPIYDRLQSELDAIEYLKSPKETYFTNKPVEMIEQDLANDYFKFINRMKPSWDISGGESYDQYRQRVTEWETHLPQMASQMLRVYRGSQNVVNTVGALREDQQINPAFFNDLLNRTNAEGLKQWNVQNDNVLDALNAAWKATYWDEYWNSGVLQGGYASDKAEMDFLAKHPQPPDANQLYAWIQQTYGDRFTLDEIKKYTGETGELSIEQRRLADQANPMDYTMRQDIWDMLSWLGPGGRNRGVFDKAFTQFGGDPDTLTAWYQENGQAFTTQPEKLQKLHDTLKQAMQALELKPPDREQLVEYIQAQNENEKFRSAVQEQLGEQFFDYTDENGQSQQGLYGYYNSLSNAEKKDFRQKHGDQYAVIKSYYRIKDAFAKASPLWADYYGFDTEPTVGSSVEVSAPSYSGGKFTPPQVKSHSSYVPFAKPTYEKQPYFGIRSRIPSNFSPDFTKTVGGTMMYEINRLYSGGQRLSTASVNFLNNLRSRHSEWRTTIDDILQTNARG